MKTKNTGNRNRKRKLTVLLALAAAAATTFTAYGATYGLYVQKEPYVRVISEDNGMSSGYRKAEDGGLAAARAAGPTAGIWVENSEGWKFRYYDGSIAQNKWVCVKGTAGNEYYHFGDDGGMNAGWFRDTDGKWYYLSEEHDGSYGSLVTGWHDSREDGHRYYLDPETGAMVTGTVTIDGKAYSFNDQATAETWSKGADGVWHFNGSSELPYGALK